MWRALLDPASTGLTRRAPPRSFANSIHGRTCSEYFAPNRLIVICRKEETGESGWRGIGGYHGQEGHQSSGSRIVVCRHLSRMLTFSLTAPPGLQYTPPRNLKEPYLPVFIPTKIRPSRSFRRESLSHSHLANKVAPAFAFPPSNIPATLRVWSSEFSCTLGGDPAARILRIAQTTARTQAVRRERMVRDGVPVSGDERRVFVILRRPAGLAELEQGEEL